VSYAALLESPAPAFVPRRRLVTRRRGMGATTSEIAGSSFTTALTSAGGIMLAIPGLQLPGAIVAAIGAIGGPIISMFKGCGQTCVQATTYANQAATAIQQIKDTYFAQPVHYRSVQQAALQQIQQIFDALRQACGNPALGTAGQNCISERLVRGGTAPWCPNPGHVGCDWVTSWYDPIANDPNVVPDPSPLTSVESSLSSVFGGTGSSSSVLPLVMAGALVLGLVYAL